MWLKVFCILCTLTASSYGDMKIPDLQNMGSILQSLQKSGMLAQFQNEFSKVLMDKMLGTNEEELSNTSETDLYEMAKKYRRAKNYKISDRILFYLSELAPESFNDKENLDKMKSLLDLIGAISALNRKEMDTQVFDTVKKGKSLSSIEKQLRLIHKDAIKDEVKKDLRPETQSSVQDETSKSKIPDGVRAYVDAVRANPSQLIEDLSTWLIEYDILPEEILETVNMYAKFVVHTPYFTNFIDSAVGWLEELSKTEGGQITMKIFPKIIAADDIEEILEIINRDADVNMNRVVSIVKQYDAQDQVAEFFGAFLAMGSKNVLETVADTTKIAFANSFLLSQGFPAIDTNNLSASIATLVKKFMTEFTPWLKFNIRGYLKLVTDWSKAFEAEYMRWQDYLQLSEDEQIKVMKLYLHEYVAETFNNLWLIHRFFHNNEDGHACSTNMLCHFASNAKRTGSKLQVITDKLMAMMFSLTWSIEESVEYRTLYNAITKGLKGEDCDLKYSHGDQTKVCHILPWQIRPFHEEL